MWVWYARAVLRWFTPVFVLVVACKDGPVSEPPSERPVSELWSASLPAAPAEGPATSPVPSNRYEALTAMTDEALRAACDGGDGLACWVIGSRVVEESVRVANETGSGAGLETTMQAAQPYFRRGCELGDADCCDFIVLEEGFVCTSLATPRAAGSPALFQGGSCGRSVATCEVVRQLLADMGWTSAEPCARRERATCYSYFNAAERRTVLSCFGTHDECEWQRATANEATTPGGAISDVTACEGAA